MAVIYEKIQGCNLGQFSTLKFVNGSNFRKFKDYFLAEYISGFVVPADTFDNVKGKFPIGFTVWNTALKSKINVVETDVFDKKGNYQTTKKFYGTLNENINRWLKSFEDNISITIGLIVSTAPDFQHDNQLCILSKKQERYCFNISQYNLLKTSIYFCVRQCIEGSWLNDRDQYTFPNDGWQTDVEFQNDCLAFMLFHGQNKITSKDGTNHWIPFTEQEVNAHEKFESHFMSDFIKGKIKVESSAQLALYNSINTLVNNDPRVFSPEAQGVFDAGRELWKYYHQQPNVNVNASLYDIREYFQGRNEKGKMNNKSSDEKYNLLISELRSSLKILASKIAPKVYEYGFLKE
jgi:hypothetical protein